MFTGELSDVWCKGGDWVNTVGRYLCTILWIRDLPNWGGGSCKGLISDPPDIFFNHLKPNLPQRSWFMSLILFHFSHQVLSFSDFPRHSLPSGFFLKWFLNAAERTVFLWPNVIFSFAFSTRSSSFKRGVQGRKWDLRSKPVSLFCMFISLLLSLVSFSLMVSQSQWKPCLQFSRSGHLFPGDNSASLSSLLHLPLMATQSAHIDKITST